MLIDPAHEIIELFTYAAQSRHCLSCLYKYSRHLALFGDLRMRILRMELRWPKISVIPCKGSIYDLDTTSLPVGAINLNNVMSAQKIECSAIANLKCDYFYEC